MNHNFKLPYKYKNTRLALLPTDILYHIEKYINTFAERYSIPVLEYKYELLKKMFIQNISCLYYSHEIMMKSLRPDMYYYYWLYGYTPDWDDRVISYNKPKIRITS
jgi:hypothetical protein